MAGGLHRTKSIDMLMHDSGADGESGLKRTLGAWSLVGLGIGAIIGAGLFVRTAAAIAERAGPSVTLAFMVAGLGCAFAGRCTMVQEVCRSIAPAVEEKRPGHFVACHYAERQIAA